MDLDCKTREDYGQVCPQCGNDVWENHKCNFDYMDEDRYPEKMMSLWDLMCL